MKTCKNGHMRPKELTRCETCNSIRTKNYYLKNKDKFAERQRYYHMINKEEIREKRRIERLKNRNAINEKKRDYVLANKELVSEKRKAYEIKNKESILAYRKSNSETIKVKQKAYRQSNKKSRNAHIRSRRKTDIQFRLMRNLRNRLHSALKNKQKRGSAVRDLGCTGEELKLHLESLFEPGMSWNNYGNKEGQWSIDHIIPLSKVDLTNKEEFLKVNHYTNLRPMWHIDNIKKGNK